MKAITKIVTINFQSHERTIIEPAGGGQLTVFTGPTDSGKSSILRALRCVLYNAPMYFRVGCTSASIEITFDNGTIVTRSRSAATNRYTVAEPGKEVQVYEGFNRDVPLEVQQAMGVRPLEIAGVTFEVNLARQHDPAFLVSGVSAPARAKVLGQLAGVEPIDMAIRDAGGDLFDGQREAKQLGAQITELEEQVAKYDYLPGMKERIDALEVLLGRIDDGMRRRDALVNLRSRLQRLTDDEIRAAAIAKRTAGAAQASDCLRQAVQAIERQRRLTRLRVVFKALDLQQKSAEDLRSRTADAGVVIAQLRGVASLIQQRNRAARLSADVKRLEEEQVGAKERSRASAGAETAFERLARASEIRAQRGRLLSIRTRLVEIESQDQQARARLVAAAGATPALEALAKAKEFSDVRARAIRLRERLQAQKQDEQKALGARDLAADTRDRARRLYAEALQEAGRCPTCGRPGYDHTHLKEVV